MKTSKRVGVDLAPAAKIDDPVIKVPRTFQDCIDVIRISRDGDFQVADNKYSRTYEMSEINYRIMSDEAQENIVFDSYSELINSMQDPFKITITNLKSDIALLQKRMFMRHRGDGLDKYRDILNDNINEKMYEGSKGYEQHKYITLSAYASSYADAKDILNVAEKSLVKGMSSFNSAVSRLDSKKRLESLRGIYRMDCKNDSVIDIDKLIKRGDGFKSELANPKGMNFDPEHNQNGTYFTIGDKCVQVLYAADYPSVMTDSFLIDLVTRPVTMIASLDVMPVSREITTKLLEHNYMGIENDIANQQQRHNKQEAYSSQITYKKRVEKASIEEYMTDVAENDQNQYLVGLLICLLQTLRMNLMQYLHLCVRMLQGVTSSLRLQDICSVRHLTQSFRSAACRWTICVQCLQEMLPDLFRSTSRNCMQMAVLSAMEKISCQTMQYLVTGRSLSILMDFILACQVLENPLMQSLKCHW